MLILPEPTVGGPALLLVLSETQVDTLKRDHTSATPGMAQYADSSSLGVVEV